ncbi:MAG: orotate phosphoribosyltransferase, partial [Myxococcota bacterium]|nr:orotate phosphoribosyltransferase [Myxococcota bacterium]
MSHTQLINILKKRSVRWGSFTLASGKQSDLYVDARLTTLAPEGIKLIVEALYPLLREDITVIGGPVTGADPIIGALCLYAAQQNRTLYGCMVRKKPKGHGGKHWVEGIANVSAGSKVCVVEDTVTTGGSLLKAIKRLEDEGLTVAQCIAVVDRQEGAHELITNAGYDFKALT